MFNSLKTSIFKLQKISDTAAIFVNSLKKASDNTKSPVGVLLYDEQADFNLKTTINNLKTSSEKLNKDIEALQHNFLLRKYFKKELKKNEKINEKKN